MLLKSSEITEQLSGKKKKGVRITTQVMFKCYEIDDLKCEFHYSLIIHARRKLRRSSIYVDLDVSFLFICVFLKSRQTCVFYTTVSFKYFTCPICMGQTTRSILYFTYLLPTINFRSVISHYSITTFLYQTKSQMHK